MGRPTQTRSSRSLIICRLTWPACKNSDLNSPRPCRKLCQTGSSAPAATHRELGIACRFRSRGQTVPPAQTRWLGRPPVTHSLAPAPARPSDIVNVHIMAPHMRPYARSLTITPGATLRATPFFCLIPPIPPGQFLAISMPRRCGLYTANLPRDLPMPPWPWPVDTGGCAQRGPTSQVLASKV